MKYRNQDTPPTKLQPSSYLVEHLDLILKSPLPGPVLDLACGGGHNGLFLASLGQRVILVDRSEEALSRARRMSTSLGIHAEFIRADLETKPPPPLEEDHYGCILVFRYLHRPLFPTLKGALRSGGVVVYETFTKDQRRFGRPQNPDFLLDHGELLDLFRDWHVLDSFEGVLKNPSRAIARLICRKP